MSRKKIIKDIILISLPVIFETLTEYFLRLVDTAFIGQYDSLGLSAIQNAITPEFTLLSFFIALSKGTTILIAQNIGSNKLLNAKRFAEVSFFYNTIISHTYFVFWMLFSPLILRLMGNSGEVYTMALSYLRIVIFSYLFFGIILSSRCLLEGIGQTFPMMIATIIMTFMNIFLDWVLIFGKFGFPEMGIRGAALATFISQLTGSLFIVFWAFKQKTIKISIKGIFKPNIKYYLKVCRYGLPAGLEFIIWSLGFAILLRLVNTIDQFAAGIFGIFNLVINFSFYLYLGISVAAMTVVGKKIGAKDYRLAKIAGNTTTRIGIYICTVSSILFILFPKQIISIFSNDRAFIESNYYIMYIAAAITFPKSVNVIIGNVIRATGNTVWMLITQIPGTILTIIMSIFSIFAFKAGIAGIFIVVFIDESWRAILNYFKFFYDMKKLNR